MENKKYISIKEMAKLRNMTAETLRYYDRIGLFQPEYVDPNTKYRYYSLSQYEKLGTIRELRQLGMSIDEITDYFNDRNLQKSRDILARQYKKLCTDIDKMLVLREALMKKLEFMNNMGRFIPSNDIIERPFPMRHCVTLGYNIEDNTEYGYVESVLESNLTEEAPILASNRVGSIIGREDFLAEKTKFGYMPIVLCDKDAIKDPDKIKEIPAGLYVSFLHHGQFGRFTPDYYRLVHYYLQKNGYEICGDILHIYQIDVTITSRNDERSLEIQIPVTQK